MRRRPKYEKPAPPPPLVRDGKPLTSGGGGATMNFTRRKVSDARKN